jgi:serine-type D-Ala-D-Ala carboxypeptidase (penicillin-binding protein 5/6)
VARKGRHRRGAHAKTRQRTEAASASSVVVELGAPSADGALFTTGSKMPAVDSAFVAAPDAPLVSAIVASPDVWTPSALVAVPEPGGSEQLFTAVPDGWSPGTPGLPETPAVSETPSLNPLFIAAPDAPGVACPGALPVGDAPHSGDAPPGLSDPWSSPRATERAPTEPVSPTLILTAGARGRAPHRRGWRLVAIGLVVVVVGAGAAIQLTRPLPRPAVHSVFVGPSRVPGVAPVIPWPAKGEAAVAVPALGVDIDSATEPSVPIASLTKLMTAYLILTDHPLAPDAQGPVVQLTAGDQAEAAADQAAGATSVPVAPGEQLSERQLLDGLLVHSANNLADVLARWDAGSVSAFVQKMNQTAAALGMRATHYADADGLSTATVSSADDQLRVAGADMDLPTFAAVVGQRSVRLPIAGVLSNYVTSVGIDGIVGVKSGFTQAAMGCLVLAAERDVGGRLVLILAAVTGQPGANPLAAANVADLRLIGAVGSGLTVVPISARGTAVATVTTPWSAGRVSATTTSALTLVGWPGQQLDVRVTIDPLRPGASSGTRVATLSASAGPERDAVDVTSEGKISVPTWSWRLLRH